MKLYPIDEVWGIGRRYAARLEALGMKTAYDFAEHNQSWVRATFNNIVIVDDYLPIATCRLYAIDDTKVMLGRVVVLPEYRNKGIGFPSIY